jgi:beta-glucosidase
LALGEITGMADAIVAAWLPGTEGAGVADVLFGDAKFTGKLSFSWKDPAFKVGFGL